MNTYKELIEYANANLPTRFGTFRVTVFRDNTDGKEHLAIQMGEIGDGKDILVRLHSECLTSEVLGSLKCDCREQLESALNSIAQKGRGVVIYLRQEGRGIGLGNKIRAYALQEQGYDTVEANQILGFEDDLRDYRVAGRILKTLGIRSAKLLTNNPRKIEGLEKCGISVLQRVPLQIKPNPLNIQYLKTKATKSGHWLNFRNTHGIENLSLAEIG